MTSNTASLPVKELEATLAKIFPKLAQLLEEYQISKPLEIHLGNIPRTQTSEIPRGTCCFQDGFIRCPCIYSAAAHGHDEALDLGLTSEQSEQFCNKVAASLDTILPRLNQSLEQLRAISEIQFFIDPATANSGRSVIFEIADSGTLQCKVQTYSDL